MYVFPLSGKDIKLANKAVKRSLSGDLKPVTRSPRGKYNTYTQERVQIGKYTADNRAIYTSRSFWIVRSAVSIVELSDKKHYMFSSITALHVVRLGLRNMPI